ncbi:MAG: glycosyltransferase family 4 protein [Nitrospira sp.]|nr:glycosyltransferase family 4 protein [Nitrospira sp.]
MTTLPVNGSTLAVSIPMGSFHLSGGVKVLVLVGNGMAARGWRVTFLAPDFASTSPFPLDPQINVTVISTGPSWLHHKLRKAVYYAKLMLRAISGADLCLANYYLTAYCAVASCWLSGGRSSVLWYIQAYEAGSHGLLAEDGIIGRLLRYVLASMSYRLPVPILCVSQWVRERIGRADAKVVYPPVLNLEVFGPRERPDSNGVVVIGTIGRRGATKGYEDFLLALDGLPDRGAIHVLVASPEPNEVPLPAGVSAERIHATTESAMAEFYRRCDIFVLCSRMEGFPFPPLESMACGCAVVATVCGGIVEYAQDGVNCLLVPVRNPRALSQAISLLCRDAALREKLVREGLKTAGRFDREPMVEQFVRLVAVEVGGG